LVVILSEGGFAGERFLLAGVQAKDLLLPLLARKQTAGPSLRSG
jgi:hypothetical protein